METYAKALTYAIPFFFLLILVEAGIGYTMGIKVNRAADTVSSLNSGLSNALKDVLGLSVAIVSYKWLYEHFAFFHIENTILVYVMAFIGIDFAGYWMHRFSHEINFLWNRHMIHHSSEEFNLACALRQSITNYISFIALFMVPAVFVGVPPEVIAVVAPIQLFAQFWYHTVLIKKMGFFEYFLVTPSHHRVHHAMNSEYLDKNYSQIFIVWDRIFGTFQEELDHIPPVFGVKKPAETWNPIIINFQHFIIMAKDAWHTKNWWDKLTLWFRKTGYRPADVAALYPIEIIEDATTLIKYETNPSIAQSVWAFFQTIVTLFFMFYMFNQIAVLSFSDLCWYSLYLFASIYSYTTLLDKKPSVIWPESFRFLLGLGLLIYGGWDWFGIKEFYSYASSIVLALMLISFILTYYWSRGFEQEQAAAQVS